MPKDFLFLVENYDAIDFDKIAIEYGNFTNSKAGNRYRYLIDGKIGVVAHHYIKDEKIDKPTKIDTNLHIRNIEEYMVNKYKQRLARMRSLDPIFVFSAFSLPQFDVSSEDIENFLAIDTPYKKMLLVKDKSFLTRKAKNTRIFLAPSGSALVNAKEIYKTIWKR